MRGSTVRRGHWLDTTKHKLHLENDSRLGWKRKQWKERLGRQKRGQHVRESHYKRHQTTPIVRLSLLVF